jgi:Protein of unknown function DUF45
MMPIHPDDVLLFKEVSEAMHRVAQNYKLPLKTVTGYPMPRKGMANRLGDCGWDGNIRLVLRCTIDGEWESEPIHPDKVWDTAAHELAHLRHMNHGLEFQDFCEELQVAMQNQREDHKTKILQKLQKLQASRQGEAELGNTAAAEAFASMINKMLIEYELNPSDIDYARATDNDPIIELQVNKSAYRIEDSKARQAWQESLAMGVAKAHLCTILIRPGSNDIIFVGTKSHATVAEYVYGTMVPAVAKMSKDAEVRYWRETGCGRGKNNKALGYRAAWIDSFINRIWERFQEARLAAVKASAEVHGTSQETGLMRLDGALMKVRQYIDNKFAHRRAASRAGVLNHRSRNHTDGRAAGREAANRITLGQRGIGSGAPPKLLGD